MFLSDEDVQRLTGRTRPSAQCRWLLANGYPHEINGLGKPLLLRSVIEQRLGGALEANEVS